MQKPGNTTTESRKNDYSLLVVLDGIGEASGDLFLDDGLSIDIKR
jgi:alpha-glucosidase